MKPPRLENRSRRLGSVASLALAIVLPIAILGCAAPPAESVGAAEGSATENWRCRNDLEVRCGKDGCETAAEHGFTPMDATVDDSGTMSVCAYSGCWEGVGEVVRSGNFLVLIGRRLEFSTSPGSESSRTDILIAIDRTDGVATLKAGSFALPLLCESNLAKIDNPGGRQ